MNSLHLLAFPTLLAFAASGAGAQGPSLPSRSPPRPEPAPVIFVQTYQTIEPQYPPPQQQAPGAEAPPPADAPPAEPPPEPRKPYVIGETYDSLPAGCMKLIEKGAAYYYCGGEWYRSAGGGKYKAVKAP